MTMHFAKIFNNYPNPFYIIRPIIQDGTSEDFEYIYTNQAFCDFLGRSPEDLMGHRYLECFKQLGEKVWLEAFVDVALKRKHVYIEHMNETIGRKVYTEVFHIEPNLCGCIIHEFEEASHLVKSKEHEALRHQATCDYLTGFYNRFYLEEISPRILEEEKIGVTFLDINNLKRVNDESGHAAGDDMIVHVSKLIRSCYEDSLVFRIGGDEFVILTVGYNKDTFLKMSEESRKIFANGNLAALGYCFYNKIDNLGDCIEQCDLLMYEEKKRMKKEYEQ